MKFFVKDGKGEKSIIENTEIDNTGLLKNNGEDYFLKYKNVDNCWMCYYLTQEIKEIKSENDCCLKLKLFGKEKVICSTSQNACQMNLKKIIKKIHHECKSLNNLNNSTQPKTCGNSNDYHNKRKNNNNNTSSLINSSQDLEAEVKNY